PDGTARYVVGRDGGAPQHADSPERCVYTEWFLVTGLAELAEQTGEVAWLTAARRVLDRARADHLAGTAPVPPDAAPASTAYGPRMVLTDTLLTVARAAAALDQPGRERDQLAETVDAMLSHRLPDGTVCEVTGPAAHSLVTRHRVPGHAVAGVRIALESLDLLEDDRARLPLLVSLDAACLLGWDPAHGGLLRYTDTNGPYAPTGAVAGTA